MESKWPIRTLEELQSDVGKAIAIGPFGSKMKSSCYVPDGVPVIRGTNISGTKRLDGDFVYITEDKADELKGCNVFAGDLVFPHRGSIGEVAVVPSDGVQRYVLSSSIMKLTCNTGVADPYYLFYYFRSYEGRVEILRFASTVGTPGIGQPLSSLRQMRVPCPPIEEQRAIASILGALDDKIELNRRMNATLESLARAIFKSWFVDFDPVKINAGKINAGQMPASSQALPTLDPNVLDLFPSTFQDSELGPIPEGWEVKSLPDVADLLSGGTPKKKIEEYWNGDLPWISPKAMDGIHVFESDSCVTEAAVGNGTRLVPAGTTLVMVRGMGLHQGVRISQAQRDVTFNQDVKALVPTTVDCTFLLYAILDAGSMLFGKVHAAGHGTGVLSTDVIKSLEFAVSDADDFPLLTRPLTELNQRIHTNELESRVLSKLRDTLLPQLLSGELPVPAALTRAEEALA